MSTSLQNIKWGNSLVNHILNAPTTSKAIRFSVLSFDLRDPCNFV